MQTDCHHQSELPKERKKQAKTSKIMSTDLWALTTINENVRR